VPPAPGYKDGFSRVLDELVDLYAVAVLGADAGQHVHEVIDRLIVLACADPKETNTCKYTKT
jgi:hypothetical protein